MFGRSNGELDRRVTEIEEYLSKKDKKFYESLTLNQKLLALIELGIIDNLFEQNGNNNTNLAVLLALLLDVSEQNLREELSHYTSRKGSNIYTNNNLYKIKALFEKTKFSKATEKVKNEIDTLDQAKL